MASFWRLVKKVIRDADIIMLVLDARFPELTRNEEIEEKVEEQDKQLLYVLNKCDLVSEEKIEELSKRYRPSVFVSTKSKLGSTVLYKKIMKISQGEDCVVGVVGYPNVGKSSVINMLKGRSSASTYYALLRFQMRKRRIAIFYHIKIKIVNMKTICGGI